MKNITITFIAIVALSLTPMFLHLPNLLAADGLTPVLPSDTKTPEFARTGTTSGTTLIGFGLTIDDEILTVTGLKREESIRVPENRTSLTWAKYLRPEKPDEIKITITTADGRKWRAKWVEDAP